MNTYRRYLRAYAWVIVTTFLVVGLMRASLHDYSPTDLEGWEMLPDTCQTAIACSLNNPKQ